MNVYRVEHKKDKTGPYWSKSNIWRWELQNKHGKDNKRPGWMVDGLPEEKVYDKDWRFGFETLSKARKWFSNATEYLEDYHIVKYRCDAKYVVRSVSRLQLIFSALEAKEIGNESI
jgi:hypothetical protein